MSIKAMNVNGKPVRECLLGGGVIMRSDTGTYEVLEYLESSGAQYLDTRIVPNGQDRYEILAWKSECPTSEEGIFGILGNNVIMGILTKPANTFFAYKNGTGANFAVATEFPSMLDLVLESGRAVFNGEEYSWDKTFTGASNTMYLFCYNHSRKCPFSGRVYSFKRYVGEDMTHCLVPARRIADGVLGMYDSVNDKFLTNRGTGVFVAGPATGEWI